MDYLSILYALLYALFHLLIGVWSRATFYDFPGPKGDTGFFGMQRFLWGGIFG